MALPTAGVVYDVEWKNSCIVAAVMERKQIDQFCEGLTEEVMNPVAAEISKLRSTQFLICCCLCMFFFVCGII
jgi:hypothetical protein